MNGFVSSWGASAASDATIPCKVLRIASPACGGCCKGKCKPQIFTDFHGRFKIFERSKSKDLKSAFIRENQWLKNNLQQLPAVGSQWHPIDHAPFSDSINRNNNIFTVPSKSLGSTITRFKSAGDQTNQPNPQQTAHPNTFIKLIRFPVTGRTNGRQPAAFWCGV